MAVIEYFCVLTFNNSYFYIYSMSKGLSKKSSHSSFVEIQEEFFRSLRDVHGRGPIRADDGRLVK